MSDIQTQTKETTFYLVVGAAAAIITTATAFAIQYGPPTIPWQYLFQGIFGSIDFALLASRLALGVFFVLARFRWLYDPSREPRWLNPARHDHLAWKLCSCGYSRNLYLADFVAIVEIAAGVALVVGFVTPLASLALLATLLFATRCTAVEKTLKQNPVDKVDAVSCYLWTVEPHLIVFALVGLTGGPGAYSIDALILRLL